MKITIQLPAICGMYHRTTFTIQDPSTLAKVKQLVFEKFQQTLSNINVPSLQLYATAAELVLRGQGEVICCEDKWNCIQKMADTFDAYFVGHPFEPEHKPIDLLKDPYTIAKERFHS